MKQMLPHAWRQAIKRRLFVVRDMTSRLHTLRRSGFVCTGAIDGGAYQGNWAHEFWSVYPSVPVLMVEPQATLQQKLRELACSVSGSDVLAAALSNQVGTVSFALQESNSGIRNDAVMDEPCIHLPCTTLAAILAERPSFKPNLLKLDLQGHELQAMRGAGVQLQRFEVIISEMSVIPIGGVPAFAEVNHFFEAQGYQFYDVLPQYDRPLDGALWQLDAFYVRHGSPLITSTAWG